MQAVIETGNKQYLVKEGDEILVEKLNGEEITIDRVLLIIDGERVLIGRPTVEKARVAAKVISEEKGSKKIIFKYRRREQYKRKIGYRHKYSRIRIEKIITNNQIPITK